MKSEEAMGGHRTIRKIELSKEEINDAITDYVMAREDIPDGFSISVTLMEDYSARVDILTGDWSGIVGQDSTVGVKFCPDDLKTAKTSWYHKSIAEEAEWKRHRTPDRFR